MAASPINTFSATGVVNPVVMPELARLDARVLAPGTYVAGTVLGMTSNLTAQNDVKTITVSGTPTGGSFRLQFGDQITGAIAFNAAASAVQAAFEALSNVGTGNVLGGGGAFPGTPVTLTFQGKLAARELPSITLYANNLTGGTAPTAAVANTTPGRVAGGHLKPYADANADGSGIAKAILQYSGYVDHFGYHNFGPGEFQSGSNSLTTPVWIRGTFKTKELTGLDAAAVTDFGGAARIIRGDVGSLTHDGTWLSIG